MRGAGQTSVGMGTSEPVVAAAHITPTAVFFGRQSEFSEWLCVGCGERRCSQFVLQSVLCSWLQAFARLQVPEERVVPRAGESTAAVAADRHAFDP